LTAGTLVMSVVAMFSRGNLSSGEREDRGNRRVLGAFGVLAVLLAYFSAYTDRHDFWTIDGDATRWIGFVLLIVGSIVRLWPVFVLGPRLAGWVPFKGIMKWSRPASTATCATPAISAFS